MAALVNEASLKRAAAVIGLLVIAFAIVAPAFSFGTVELSVGLRGEVSADRLLLQFGRIEAHALTLRGGEWVTLANTSAPFDLLSPERGHRIAGGLIGTGNYDGLRLLVVNATMVKEGKSVPLLGQKVIIAMGNFTIKFARTTPLTVVISADPAKLTNQHMLEATAKVTS